MRRWVYRCLPLAILLAVAAALIGRGGDDETAQPRAEAPESVARPRARPERKASTFVQRARRVCQRARRRAGVLQTEDRTVRSSVTSVLASGRRRNRELRALRAPPALRSRYRRFLAEADVPLQVMVRIEQLRPSETNGSVTGSMVQSLGAFEAQLERRARRFGGSGCGHFSASP